MGATSYFFWKEVAGYYFCKGAEGKKKRAQLVFEGGWSQIRRGWRDDELGEGQKGRKVFESQGGKEVGSWRSGPGGGRYGGGIWKVVTVAAEWIVDGSRERTT